MLASQDILGTVPTPSISRAALVLWVKQCRAQPASQGLPPQTSLPAAAVPSRLPVAGEETEWRSAQLEPREGGVPRIAITCITSLTLGGGGRPPGSWTNSGSAQHLQHCPPACLLLTSPEASCCWRPTAALCFPNQMDWTWIWIWGSSMGRQWGL